MSGPVGATINATRTIASVGTVLRDEQGRVHDLVRPVVLEFDARREVALDVGETDDGHLVTGKELVPDALYLAAEFQVGQVPAGEVVRFQLEVLCLALEVEQGHVLLVVTDLRENDNGGLVKGCGKLEKGLGNQNNPKG